MPQTLNRRRFERFALPPMYTAVSIRPQGPGGEALDGHVYDISEAGLRFELDRAIEPGTAVDVQITLPGSDEVTRWRMVAAMASVVWVNEDADEPGPVRMAAVFTGLRAADRERLLRALSSGRYARAA